MASEDPAVTNFREYLRINTMQPKPDYEGAVKYLTKMADELELPYKRYDVVPGKPVFIITWEGSEPSLPALLLSSHIDVVPVFPECWKVDPFSAYKDEDGDIYARGAQDMKCVSQQYIEAVRRLKSSGRKLLRTVHMIFTPDEEISSVDGMAKFVHFQEFKDLNAGFILDEGIANPEEPFFAYYGERIGMAVEIICKGQPGHGSQFLENTCGEKMRRVIDSFMDFRAAEKKRLEDNPDLRLGDVTTVNMVMAKGGVQTNVVPAELRVRFDIRVTPHVTKQQFEDMVRKWCDDAGPDVTYEFQNRIVGQTLTPKTKDDPWWNAFITPLEDMNLKIQTEIFPAGTDSRFLREQGYKAIGFSPMNNTPVLLHDHNEYLNEKIFLRGIEIYENVIPSLANVPQ